MLGFARKLLYRAASAIERRRDKNYYFLGFENKIDHIHAFDLLLKLFEGKSAGAELKFWRLVDIAAEMDESDPASFKLKTAISGAGFFEGISVEGCEYLLEKAYRRGISLRDARRLKDRLTAIDMAAFKMARNLVYGGVARRVPPGAPVGSVFVTPEGKIMVKV